MRTVLLTVPFILAASASFAQPPNSLAMSCARARSLVQQNGEAVIGTGPNVYDRYVIDQRYCADTERADPAWIETADDPQCLVGRYCVERRWKRRH